MLITSEIDYCLSNRKFEILNGPLWEKVIVSVVIWHHDVRYMIRETRCQVIGCLIRTDIYWRVNLPGICWIDPSG